MPNHVENRLTFDCSRERLQEILTAISRDQDKEVDGKFGVGSFDFEKVIPMPEDIYRGNLGSAERELYGKKNWYDWSVWNWGNAACEGFFGHLKNELFYNHSWQGIGTKQFMPILNDYLIWYREKRIKLSFHGLSPIEYRRKLGLI